MTSLGFDGESVIRYMMTDFDVIEDDNRMGVHRVFAANHADGGHPPPPPPPGMSRKPSPHGPQPTILGHLQSACRAIIFKRNHHAALFVAHFMRASGHLVKQLSFREDLRETVLEAVMNVATRRDVFNLQTREFVLKSAMESAMFSRSQRERLLERLANMWGEAIWATENGTVDYPVNHFEKDEIKYRASIKDLFGILKPTDGFDGGFMGAPLFGGGGKVPKDHSTHDQETEASSSNDDGGGILQGIREAVE